MSFNVMERKEREEYEEILNDPLCSITTNVTQILKEIDYDPDTGKPMRQVDLIIRTVEWDVKVLL